MPPGKLVTNGTLNLPFNESSTPELIATTLPVAEAESTECAYVTDDGLGVLHEFTINVVTGALTQLPGRVGRQPAIRNRDTPDRAFHLHSECKVKLDLGVLANLGNGRNRVHGSSDFASHEQSSGSDQSLGPHQHRGRADRPICLHGKFKQRHRRRILDQHDNRSANPNRRSQHRNSAKPRQPANFRGNDVLEGWPDRTQSRSRKRAANPCQTVADSIRISAARMRATVRRFPSTAMTS